MDRIISEEKWEHISKLSEIRSKYSCFEADEEPYYRALSEGIKALKAIPSAEPKWISTSERLPQINEWVLCQCRAGCKVLMLTSYGCYCNDTQEYMDSFVIAWMPLPPCYKPQEISDRNLKMWEDIYAEEKRRERSDKE